ncbi:outer membrane beta-barrel protein [Chryseobacterium sp. NEB161]|nr:outer membrane beta-barrel protein [Chryseobacterium sp. NEB161]
MKKLIVPILVLCGISIFSQDKTSDSISSTKEIEEVILKSQRKKQYADRAVYTFDKEALDKARYAKDLITTLPELQIDPISNTLKSTKGGTTLFLINGIEASDMQIRSVQPAEVVRVEYYDIPPARWATRADQIVNIITRNPETGYVFGADTTTAFNTGFVNASAYGNYTKGQNDFGVEYSINLRDYDNRTVKSIYDYQLGDSHYRSEEDKKDHFGYTYQNIALRYTRSVPENYAFQAKLNLDLFTSFVKGNGQSLFNQDAMTELHGMFKNGNSDYTKPTLDLYFSKNIGKKDELSINFVGSDFSTNTLEVAREWEITSGNLVYNNDMNLKAKQSGIVGEIAHVHTFEKGKLSSGYRISNTAISNELLNLEGFSQYEVNYLEQYFYTEYSGKLKKLNYRLGAGLTNIHNKSAETVDDNWSFNPKVILSYTVKNNQTVRFTSSYRPQSPWSAALSSNVVQIAPNIVQRGNPYLKPKQTFHTNLQYSYNNKYFDFNSILFYNYMKGDINQYYAADPLTGGYALMYENSKYTRQFGVQFSGSVKPFGSSILVIKANLVPTSVKLVTNTNQEIRNNYINNYFVISSEYKSLSVQYQFNFPVYTLNGAFLNTNENANHFFASYKLKEWTLTGGMYWIGMPSDYKTKSLPESLVNYSRRNQIWNNKSMFVLGVNYDFSKGKKTQIDKKLNNSTAPAATF